MDIEKLIERLRTESLYKDKATLEIMDLCMDAATTLSTIQAENKRLKSLLGESGQDLWSKENQRADRLEAENEKLRAELERVKRERGAAIADWQGFCAKCVWNGKQYLSDGKMDDRCKTCRDNNKCNWEWRGIKED